MSCGKACPVCTSLRAAALQLVNNSGVPEFSVAGLCERSGLTPEAVRAHYPTAAECLYDAFEEISGDMLIEVADAFARSSSWPDALDRAGRRVLARMADHPAEARLCFVEVLGGDRELLRRRDGARRRMVELFVAEHHRRSSSEQLPDMQLELLIGASFQLIAAQVADGRVRQLPQLGSELAELADVFEPAAA
jgi:AcrR family transcriptional regulator